MADVATCPGCGLPYNRTPPHVIDTLPDRGIVAYCEMCHNQLTLGAKKSHISNLIGRWRRNGKNYDEVWQIALDVADFEHFQKWGKILT
jgi:hypothetical protein